MTPRDLLELIRRTFRSALPAAVSRRPEAKLVLVCLAAHADADGTHAYPSRDTIAAQCELGTRTVDKILRDLAAAHVIVEQAPPTQHRPRMWQLQPLAVHSSSTAFPQSGSQIEMTLSPESPPGSQMNQTAHSFATDQVQVQEQEQYKERAAAHGAALLAADANYTVILKLTHAVLDVINTGPARASLAEVVEAVKEQCARAHIVYSSAVVHRAVAAALVQRVKLAPVDAGLRDDARRREGA